VLIPTSITDPQKKVDGNESDCVQLGGVKREFKDICEEMAYNR